MRTHCTMCSNTHTLNLVVADAVKIFSSLHILLCSPEIGQSALCNALQFYCNMYLTLNSKKRCVSLETLKRKQA